MRRSYFYKHVSASDIYIQVDHVRQIKSDEYFIKCRVFSTLYNCYYETTKFRLHKDDLWKWSVWTPGAPVS
jgi:hypothetical protein